MFPHSKSEDEMSDRCAWYVGLSRAEKILEISYWGAPSPYIRLTQEIKCDSIDVEVKECE